MSRWLEIETGPEIECERVFVRADAIIAVGGVVSGVPWVPVTLVNGATIRAYCFPGIDDHENAGFGLLMDSGALDVEMIDAGTADAEPAREALSGSALYGAVIAALRYRRSPVLSSALDEVARAAQGYAAVLGWEFPSELLP